MSEDTCHCRSRRIVTDRVNYTIIMIIPIVIVYFIVVTDGRVYDRRNNIMRCGHDTRNATVYTGEGGGSRLEIIIESQNRRT